ncbi:S1 RNA-binding domain containing protein 1 [Dissostichus eleginoides]|uniref:S1 RNA-binding domain containing protein 1 n=1 Tax=Dissostichus eleginoides TaxID=100907 RepID=A0AAD9FGW6_DISEL|nr:S1 RNA-binding domain containing protein 1 [Dissostichus eleginoides]
MMRRPRTTTAKVVENTYTDSDLSISTILISDEESDEWTPAEPTLKAPTTTARAPAVPGEKKAAPKRTAKPKVPKAPKQPKSPKEPKVPKPRAPRKTAAERKTQASKVVKGSRTSVLAGTKRKNIDEGKNDDKAAENKEERHTDCPKEERAEESGPSTKMKKERVSFIVSKANQADMWAGEGKSLAGLIAKKEEVEDFTFDEPCLKKQKTGGAFLGQPSALPSSAANALRNELNMDWDFIEVLSTLTCVEPWVCVNIIGLLREENTVPFMVRYRKDKINHMDADAVRDVQLVYEVLGTLSKKTQSVIQTLKKDGVLTVELEQNLRSCRSADELDHVYSPYKKGSKLTKARRAKALGLEDAASLLMNTPHTLELRTWVKPGTEGLSSVEEVSTGVEHILADLIAKDPETLTYVKTLCENSFVTIQSSVSKSALKEKEQKSVQDHKKPGAKQNKKMDIDKFHLYVDFTSNIQRIQPHQTLAINRGESLKILTVKVNIPDRVKNDFTRWCIDNRWKPKTFPREEHWAIVRSAIDDSYKRLILPFLTRSYRTKLSSAAEKESIAMFVSNLRQCLLVCPVRGCVILGVDPGFRHGCKLAVLSPTGQIIHTDVVYLHHSGQQREVDKLRHLMMTYSCTNVVIGNGTACRETESVFADLISRRCFHPLDVSYW